MFVSINIHLYYYSYKKNLANKCGRYFNKNVEDDKACFIFNIYILLYYF